MTTDIATNIISNYEILKPQIFEMDAYIKLSDKNNTNLEQMNDNDSNQSLHQINDNKPDDDSRRPSVKEAEDTLAELDLRSAEQQQREANEETTRSEDLRKFLVEMHETFGKSPKSQGIGVSQIQNTTNNQLAAPASPTSNDIGVQEQLSMSPCKVNTYQENELQAMAAETAPMGPPDGGWAWLIVISSFVCMIAIDGTCFNYGLFVPEMMLDYGESSTMNVMWPGSLIAGFYMILCPITSALANHFDFRLVAMAGGVIASIGIFASSFTKSFVTFIVSFGIFGGIGFSLIYLPAIAVVGHWFHEKRPIAVGVALCGSGCGTFIFGQLIPILTDYFTWRGTIIIISAVCCQTLVFISLFRPLELHLRLQHYYNILKLMKKIKKDEMVQKKMDSAKKANEEKKNKKNSKENPKNNQKIGAKRIVIYRGLIMQKIIEEKKRQRTGSMGSLDGMVITRDNELIKVAMSSMDIYEKPILSVNAINRIRESVVKRLDAKIKKKGPDGIVGIADSRSIMSTENNVSHSQIKNSLPQLVQDYINSHMSLHVNTLRRQNSSNSSMANPKSQEDTTNKSITTATGMSSNTPNTGGLILEDKAKTVIQASLRKEMTRPFFQKELLYTGSIKQSIDLDVDKRSELSIGIGTCGQSVCSRQSSIQEDMLTQQLHQQVCNGGTGVPSPTTITSHGDDVSITTMPRRSYDDYDERMMMADNGSDEMLSILDDDQDVIGGSNIGPFKEFLRNLLDIRLLKSATFLVMVLSSVTTMLGIFVPFFTLPLYLNSLEMPTVTAGRLISYVGIANIIGRLISTLYIEKAWSSSHKWANSLWINNVALITAGLTAILVPFLVKYYAALVINLVIYGFFVATVVSLKSILVVELLGLDCLTNAFSFLMIFQGLATVLGAPLIGFLCDSMNYNYEVTFYFSGGAIILSGVLCFPLRLIARYQGSVMTGGGVEMNPPNMTVNGGTDQVRYNLLQNTSQANPNNLIDDTSTDNPDENVSFQEINQYSKDPDHTDSVDNNQNNVSCNNTNQPIPVAESTSKNENSESDEDVGLTALEPLMEEEEEVDSGGSGGGVSGTTNRRTRLASDDSIKIAGKNDIFEITTVKQ